MMFDRTELLGLFGRCAAASGLAFSMVLTAGGEGWPQAAPPPTLGLQSPAQQPVPAQPEPQQIDPPPRDENPGLINEIGKLFEKSKSLLPPLKSPSETIDDLNARTRDAGQSLSNMARPSAMVTGRAACMVAANGAPDCKTAAYKLCQSKGFKEGKSLDVDTTRNCSARALLSGRKPEESECRTETYVTRAVCQ